VSTEELGVIAQRLRAEIDALDAGEIEARTRFDALHQELVQRLEHPREDNQDSDLIERLREEVAAFEAAHPRATGILNDVLVTLGNMGI
jgi:hypothetical protein